MGTLLPQDLALLVGTQSIPPRAFRRPPPGHSLCQRLLTTLSYCSSLLIVIATATAGLSSFFYRQLRVAAIRSITFILLDSLQHLCQWLEHFERAGRIETARLTRLSRHGLSPHHDCTINLAHRIIPSNFFGRQVQRIYYHHHGAHSQHPPPSPGAEPA